MNTNLDMDHLRSWIGREEAASEEVTETLVQKFCATLDLALPGAGQPVPRLLHYCLTPGIAATAALGADGHPPRGGFLPPVPLPRRMWAGSDVTFLDDLYVGDRLERVSRVVDVQEKHGRTGTLCLVTVQHTYTVQDAPVIRETQNIVYRDSAPHGVVAPAPEAAPSGRWRKTVTPSTVLLFRYSALTFNAHRIHFDRGYATAEEGYPGLVVHGPLQATLLAHLAAEVRGRPPSGFTFRSGGALFDGAPYHLDADEDGDDLTLRTCTDGGPAAMTARATFDLVNDP